MNINIIKSFLMYPISGKARSKWKKFIREREERNLKLIMTLVVKDEEDILEKNIKFHKEMGIDGFIVTSHNSTDRTNEILERFKKEGIVLDIFYESTPDHKHHVWVNKMVNIAKNKYKAKWVINADADEFYYSKDLNLKKSILKYNKTNVNVLWVDSNFLFPDNRDDFLNCPYFVERPFKDFQAEILNIKDNKNFKIFINSQGCTKVIHKTKGFIGIFDGNHDVLMKHKAMIESPEIVLYHYHIKNYKQYEKKAIKWLESGKFFPGDNYQTKMRNDFESGKLIEDYNNKYSEDMRNFLIEQGVVTIDKSVSNFLSWKNI